MYHIAVVEDEIECSEQIQKFLAQYQEENNVRFKVSAFADGMQILDGYEPVYDMILMDIDMIGQNLDRGQGMCGASSGSVPTDVGQPLLRVSKITVGGR